jgi:hypothetical protein
MNTIAFVYNNGFHFIKLLQNHQNLFVHDLFDNFLTQLLFYLLPHLAILHDRKEGEADDESETK